MADNKPEVAVIMGSASDWETMSMHARYSTSSKCRT